MIYNFSINYDYYISLCREYKKILDKIYEKENKNFQILEKEEEIFNKNYGYFHNIIDWKNIAISLKKNINYLSLTKNSEENKNIVKEFICNYFHIRNLIWHDGLSSKNIKIEKEKYFKRFFSNFFKISKLINKNYNKKIITDEEIEYITKYIYYIFPSEEINEINNNFNKEFNEEDLEKIKLSDDEKEENYNFYDEEYFNDEENIENYEEEENFEEEIIYK